jgi:non-specific serine/threonine protein kinase
VLEASEAHGESVIRSFALWSIGIESWRNGDRERATELLKRGLQLARQLRDVRTAASCLEVLAWTAAAGDKPMHAAVLMASAETMGGAVGNYAFLFPNLPAFHEESAQRIRNAIDTQAHEAARQKGLSLRFEDAVSYALREG